VIDVDLGLLVLRLALGGLLVTHGVNKISGPGGLAGTARWFEGLGLQPGWLHARLAAGNEIAAGVLMASGFLFPLTASAYIGLMVVAAATDHRGKGFFVFKEAGSTWPWSQSPRPALRALGQADSRSTVP